MIGDRLVSRFRGRWRAWIGPVAWGLAMTAAMLYGRAAVKATDDVAGPAVDVAVVQTNVPQSNRVRPSVAEQVEDWRELLALTAEAATTAPRPALVIWPETVVPAALNEIAITHFRRPGSVWAGADGYRDQVVAAARELDVSLLVGAHAWLGFAVVETADGRSFEVPSPQTNAAYLFVPGGAAATGRYDKVHRVPFGEYLPWVERWPWLKRRVIAWISPWEVDYTLTPGKRPVILDVPVGGSSPLRVAAPICFEDTVSRLVRQMVWSPQGGKRVDLLVNLSNDGWFAGSAEAAQHRQAATLRCIENRVPMARAVNTGSSGFVDPAGRIGPVVSVGGRTEDVAGHVAAPVRPDPRRTLFARWGHGPAWGLALLTFGLVVVAVGRRRFNRGPWSVSASG